MRLAILLALVACTSKESYDDCMTVELRKHHCAEPGELTAAGLQFIRETCESSEYRKPRADDPACLEGTTCKQFLRCIYGFQGDGSPFGLVH